MTHKQFAWICALIGMSIYRVCSAAEERSLPHTDGDLYADTWVATDGAGRTLLTRAECGAPKPDKWVGIFYWTWHTSERRGPYDNSKILRTATNGTVAWPPPGDYHWGEPELGYYVMTDPFVIRKHASMLADAGVDVILFDTTNPPFTWKPEYEALCREYTLMRQSGARTPQIAFITPFGDPRPVADQLWRDLYKPGLWKDLWFKWQGKPLLLADKAFIKDPDMLAFFTFRRPMPDYWVGPSAPDQWSWLEVYPQHAFTNSAGKAEQMGVGVAQNALPGTPGPAPMSHRTGAMGRSWHNGKKEARSGAVDLGFNFDEQWRRALEVDPAFIFITGWNEWIAGRYTEWSKYTDRDCYFPGGLFVDEYTQEYSRDCEPMRGGHTDNYYYQMAAWIRRYKGVRELPRSRGASRIKIDGSFRDWQTVLPEFCDTIGDTIHRQHRGYGNLVYTNNSGRNDIVLSKAAYDAKNLYFFAQTAGELSSPSGSNWMLLFLDADQSASTGWMGYDYVVNLKVLSHGNTALHQWEEGSWKMVGKAKFRTSQNKLEIALPRKLVGLGTKQTSSASASPRFDFHWADNVGSLNDISEFGLNGDSAPNRRFNYRFE